MTTSRFACLVLLTGVLAGWHAPPLMAGSARPDLDQLQRPALEDEKLREEIRALWKESDETWWRRPETVPILAALAALLSVVLTFAHQTREFGRQRKADRAQAAERAQEFRHQQEADREEQAAERRRRYDELFATVGGNLASDAEALRLAAASSIEVAFLADASDEGREGTTYRTQVFGLLVNVLSLERNQARLSDRVLARVLVKGLTSHLPSSQEQVDEPQPGTLSLDGVFLQGTQLSGLDLRGVSFEGADLHGVQLNGANLTACNLRGALLQRAVATGHRTTFGNALLMDANLEEADFTEARMRGTRFDGARLVSATFHDADLTHANFTNSRLQEAHLDGTTLIGAVFDGADLANAYFRGAVLGPSGSYDDQVFESILRAHRWRDANWDPPVLARLEELAATIR